MLPKDPNILVSMVNMKLRDFYPSLEALCDDMDESREEIEKALGNAGWIYDGQKNQFVRKG